MTEYLIFIGLAVVFGVLMLLGFEIVFSIGVTAYLWLLIADQPTTVAFQQIFGSINIFVLLAVPFFLLASELMNRSKITRSLIRFANLTIGRFRGGLAQANVVSSLLFAGITGAAIADVAALGSVFVPSMADEGYDRDFSAAVTAASSLIGPIIPPSIIIVVFGGVTNISVGKLFAAAIIPGLILGVALVSLVAAMARINNFPRYDVKVDREEYPSIASDTVIALTMPAIILLGILGGVFTPTEAAAVACVYAVLVGMVFYRTLSIKDIYHSLELTTYRTAQLLAIVGVSGMLSWLLAREEVPEFIVRSIQAANLGSAGFMLVVCIALLFIGTWLEVSAATIILAPTLVGVANDLSIPVLQFSIVIIVTLNMGLITPPVGICLFTASGVSDVPVWQIAKRIMPFFIIDIVVLLIIILVPELTLAIPDLIGLEA
jgi:tripartite ATP-independent transporter DctM subunit